MKVYGPFRGINNPLIMGMFGLQVLDEGLKIYQAHHEAQQQDLLAHSLTSGQVEPSEPGGPIRQGLSKLTGGFVSPDVQADPETILAERQAQQQQESEKLKGLSLVGAIRNNIGSGPFSAGSPLDAMQQQYGGSPGMMAGETQKEKVDRERVAQQQITNERLSPEGQRASAVARKSGEIAEESSPEGMALFRNRTAATASAGAAARIAEESSPAGLGLFGARATMTADIANEKAAQRDQQKKDALDNTPVSDSTALKGVYVHRGTYKTATGAEGEPKTKKEAENNLDYTFVPNKQVSGPGGLQDTLSQAKEINDFIRRIDSGEVDDIFPSEKNKNFAAINQDRIDYGTYNFTHKGSDPRRIEWYNNYAKLIRYYTGLQHRFPSTKEMQVPLIPDPGGVIPAEHPILRLGGANPFRLADTKEVARKKFVDMRDTILGHFSTGAGIGTLEGDDEDAADFTAAARKAGAMK